MVILRHQSGFKTEGRGASSARLKNWGSWVLKVQKTEARSTELRVSFMEFLFNYTQIILFLKSHLLWNMF